MSCLIENGLFEYANEKIFSKSNLLVTYLIGIYSYDYNRI